MIWILAVFTVLSLGLIAYRVGTLMEDVRKILRRERAKLEKAAKAWGPDPPKDAHRESSSYKEWLAPQKALAEFDEAWPEVKGE